MEKNANKSKCPSTGKIGERIALAYLENNGYLIREKNYRFGRGEIDIIAEKDQKLIFFEVKTKKFGDFGDPINWITRKKQLQISRVARGYLYENNIVDKDCQFDVITLSWEGGTYSLNHIENAFWL